MGDAAHAMVPFYGQGMNCGFEDCLVLEELLEQYQNENPDPNQNQDHLPEVLERYTAARVANCHSIIDLAMYNYIEMRHLVNKKSFLLRKHLDNLLYRFLPNGLWVPLYTMVTFTRIPYRKCVDDRQWQDEVLSTIGKVFIVIAGLLVFLILASVFDFTSGSSSGPMLTRGGPMYK